MVMVLLLGGGGLWGAGRRVEAAHSRTDRALDEEQVEVDAAVCRVAGGHGMSPGFRGDAFEASGLVRTKVRRSSNTA
ncbi:hypothetical protein GCM10025782_34240 [Pedococcus ginsenosidimutans]|uniref:Uncharacterized protein n=1 Tax=Pedococcus ginsenosidimutans TaxID=490570 RepID=A0ABP8YMC6_9MICO